MDPAGRNSSSEWSARPWTARAIRAVVYAGPLLVSIAVAWFVSSVAPRPESFTVAVVRWIAIAGMSTVVLVGLDKLARRLLPLATLFNLTLAFPDQAPSRYQLALRRGSTTQLRVRVAEARAGRLGDTPAEAAERVLELVMALSVHDRLTRGHSERVRAYTEMIGEEMGLTPVELDRLRWAGLLHDVGKLMVSADILNKPGRLTAAEFDVIKQHPEFGRQLVAPLQGWLGEAARAVWEHHERWDGRGYPRGLSGTDISIAGRIVSVADAYDVMTSVRSYQKPVSATDARAELARCSGTQFDPAVVRSFLSLSLGRLRLATGPLAWLAQAPLFPSVIAAGATQGAATAATAVVGAAAASMGVGLSGAVSLPESPPVEAHSAAQVLSVRDPIEVDTGERITVASVVPGVAPGALADDVVEPTTTAAAAATADGQAPTSPTTTAETADASDLPATTTTSVAGVQTTVVTTLAPGATTTVPGVVVGDEQPDNTVVLGDPTTTVAPVATTTTTVPPSPPPPPTTPARPSWLPGAGVPTAFYLDVPNQVALPAALNLTTIPPTRRNVVTFDPDDDDRPGITLTRGGPAISWSWGGPQAARTAGATSATLYVSSTQLAPVTVVVHARLETCDAAGACAPVAEVAAAATVGLIAAPTTVDFGTIDAMIPGGGVLRLTLDAPTEAESDVVLLAGTRPTPSAITLTFP